MRLPLLLIPLACLAGCTSDANRTSAAAAPAKPAAPTATTPAPAATPAPVSTPTVSTPTPATVVAAAPKPAPSPVTADLSKFSGPTENAEHFGYDDSAERIFLYSGGAIVVPVKLTADGDYELAINAACDEADGQKAKFSVTINGQAVGDEVTCTTVDAKEYVIKAPGLKAGDHKIAIAFLNDIYKENEYDLNFFVHGVALRPSK
ncbi:MAG: hypothetical protein H0W78_12085 [Planctomycetes bacterium]|nr:hypothetical protein [Planctomycetota bacterium]